MSARNVTDVLAAVSEGSNEVGVVYATDAASVTDKVDIIAEAPRQTSLKTAGSLSCGTYRGQGSIGRRYHGQQRLFLIM